MKFSGATLAKEQLSKDVIRQRLTGEKLECIIYTYEPGAKFASHSHGAEQITIGLSGELVFAFNDQDVAVQSGEAILIESERPHGAFVPDSAGVTKTYTIFSPVREQLPGV